jgi:hypothetical protein
LLPLDFVGSSFASCPLSSGALVISIYDDCRASIASTMGAKRPSRPGPPSLTAPRSRRALAGHLGWLLLFHHITRRKNPCRIISLIRLGREGTEGNTVFRQEGSRIGFREQLFLHTPSIESGNKSGMPCRRKQAPRKECGEKRRTSQPGADLLLRSAELPCLGASG